LLPIVSFVLAGLSIVVAIISIILK
jgi:hypothetical protein